MNDGKEMRNMMKGKKSMMKNCRIEWVLIELNEGLLGDLIAINIAQSI